MADLTTYAGLQSAIADYLGREDLTDRIPVFIRMWEQRGNRTLRLRAMEHRAHASLPKGQGQMPLPMKRVPGQWDVFLEMRDIVWTPPDGNGSVNLWYASPDEYALLLEKTGRPYCFTVEANDLFVLPTPDQAGKLQLTYYAEIPPLGAEQPDNEILLRHPDLYLYGSLVESAVFTRGSVPVDMWAQYYRQAVADISQQETQARYPKDISMRPMRRI